MTCLSIKYSWLHINHMSRVWDRRFFLMGTSVECKNIIKISRVQMSHSEAWENDKNTQNRVQTTVFPLTACLLVSFFMRAIIVDKCWLLHVIRLLENHPTVDLHSGQSGEVLLPQKICHFKNHICLYFSVLHNTNSDDQCWFETGFSR